MRNVYDEVRSFFEEEDAEDIIISRESIEGFLRQKAWQGQDAKALSDIWRNLRYLLLYLERADFDRLEALRVQDYSLMIEWLHAHEEGFTASIRPVRRMFEVLTEFYQYLINRKLLESSGELIEAAKVIAGGKKIRRMKDALEGAAEEGLEKAFQRAVFSSEDFEEIVTAAVERLMAKIGLCFQQKEYINDLQRALFLFSGPADLVPDEEQDEFWLGFWDYYLFDYHLLADDQAPLSHFAQKHMADLPADERQILHELMSARFSVFYISSVAGQDWVECTDLFTEESFLLPNPELDYKRIKKLLFYGHIFSRDMVMVNYVTSIEVSANLRRRIQEEVHRQKAIFEIQAPGADWAAFFHRHALIVRHTIDMLITYAKVNVTPFAEMDRVYPKIEEIRETDLRISDLLAEAMPRQGFSGFDVGLAQKLWHDFYQLTKVRVQKPATWAAAVIYTFSMLNSPHSLGAETIAHDLDASAAGIYRNRAKIQEVLQLSQYDPRYLNEEGFMFSLLSN